MEPALDPSADEARQWALEELSKAVYSQGPSLVQRLLNWLSELWERLMMAGPAGAVLLPVLILAVVAAIIGIGIALGGPVRRRRLQRRGGSVEVFNDTTREAEVLRRSADAAAAEGDYALAVLERFRALVRTLAERALLTDRQGRTAHEAAEEAGTRFPDQAAGLRRAGELFDAVCYGSAQPGSGEDTWLRELDHHLQQASPVPAVVVASQGWSTVR